MRTSAFEPCIPIRGTKVPSSKNWLHEIKHNGYRLLIQREGKRVRLFTRNGFDWSDCYPLITEAALRIRNTSFVIDGEAVLLGVDGISDFRIPICHYTEENRWSARSNDRMLRPLALIYAKQYSNVV